MDQETTTNQKDISVFLQLQIGVKTCLDIGDMQQYKKVYLD